MTVILVEDDDALREATTQSLQLAGHVVHALAGAEAALPAIDAAFDGAVVSDIRMPRVDGLELLARVRAVDPDIPVILVTGHGDVAMAVAALRDGAFDFVTKPFAADHLAASVARALAHRALVLENRRLRAELESGEDGPLVGGSDAARRLRATIRQLAAADIDVLVQGETGTGKEMVAVLLHRQGPRCARPFVTINCGALPEGVAELELFGHAADSVPHTRLPRTGLIAASSGGTLLLDEIDSMPLALQARLLRVLEEREVQPVGAPRPQPVELRVVATSKADLATAVALGDFRADLYYRLAAVRLRVPPLRERDGDAALLFGLFVEEAKRQFGRADWRPDARVLNRLRAHDWPGNIRELRNFTYEAVLGARPEQDKPGVVDRPDLPTRVAAFEADAIRDALRASNGSVARALEQLRIPRKTFYDKVSRHQLDLNIYRQN